jgi:hypothetical protein
MVRSGKLDEATTARAFVVIERSALAQNQLIGDLLDVSRIITVNFALKCVRWTFPWSSGRPLTPSYRRQRPKGFGCR